MILSFSNFVYGQNTSFYEKTLHHCFIISRIALDYEKVYLLDNSSF